MLLLLAALLSLARSKTVTSVLNAPWAPTPIILEASEFLAEEDGSLFFKYLQRVGGSSEHTDEDEYEWAVISSDDFLTDVSQSLLKLSLSLRQYSARIQMFQEIATTARGSLSCDVFVQVNGHSQCYTSSLPTPTLTTPRAPLTKFDHIYRGGDDPSLPQLVLYCDFREEECMTAHGDLSGRADRGEVAYVFRHSYRPSTDEGAKVQLSGYGVELAVKSTEYTTVDDSKVDEEGEPQGAGSQAAEEEEFEGFRFGFLKQKYPDSAADLEKLREHLLDAKDAMKPLKAWQISDLGLQAAQKVLSAPGEEPLVVLAKYSQNLPSLARALSRTTVKPEVRKEIKQNQEVLQRYNVNEGDSVLLLNGMLIDLESADPFSLLKKLRSEAKTVGGLSSLPEVGFGHLNQLLKADLYKKGMKYGIDIRDPAVLYINDLSRDRAYQHWPRDLHELLRPSYPGMMKHLRRNINNVVLVLQGSDPRSDVLLKLAAMLLENSAPVRIGFVFTGDSPLDALLGAVVNYLRPDSTDNPVLREFLIELSEDGLTEQTIRSEFADSAGVKIDEAFLSDNSAMLDAGNSFVQTSGVGSGSVIVNGVVLSDLEGIEESLLETMQSQLPKLQRAVYMGEIRDSTDLLDWWMGSESIVTRYNPAILGQDSYTVSLSSPTTDELYERLNEILRYSIWLGDSADTPVPVSMTAVCSADKGLLITLLESMDKLTKTRVSFLFTSDDDASYGLWSALAGGERDPAKLRDAASAGGGTGGDRAAFSELVRSHSEVSHVVLHVSPGSSAILCNGRVVAVPAATPFTVQDLLLLETIERRSGADKITEILASTSESVMRAGSILRIQEEPSKRISFPELRTEHSAVRVPGEGPFQVEAVLNPLSKGAQQISQILSVLHQSHLISLTIFLNPVGKLSEMPVQRFYRYVLEPELRFTDSGALAEVGSRFTDLLPHLLLTMSLSTPINWMVASTRSPHDLDNIRLNDVENGVHAEYGLEYLVIEGHSHDPLRYNNPTKGLQYDLTSGSKRHDTIVMANLGYFQLKAGPGVWRLSLREGPSREIYQIAGVEGPGVLNKETGDVTVTVGDLTSTFITVDATKKPGMHDRSISAENEQAEKPTPAENQGIWSSIKNLVNGEEGAGGGASSTNDTIHIFSVASGHLYERMLGVMMQSVLAHTKNPVKFWFLKNYLSPRFINSIPALAEALGCEVEFVQYQWPSWLTSQTEKQRIIWGYKILFLDVLFPMSLKKIIFVDADQIVRADMKELVDLDLQGAPYGYTPFCDDRPEMDGFRFWKQGYWRNHLMGRAYHISALYVVDLQRFRLISAGDRLRGQYQGLSQDPNSLANLDQDLPNNMIHQVPIKSLPQEWLWCETWCSDSSKKYAKTIDLCNNPQTKEPKLERALRIAPEWQEYDKRQKEILEKGGSQASTDQTKKSGDLHSEL